MTPMAYAEAFCEVFTVVGVPVVLWARWRRRYSGDWRRGLDSLAALLSGDQGPRP